jgi:hypothetical protein
MTPERLPVVTAPESNEPEITGASPSETTGRHVPKVPMDQGNGNWDPSGHFPNHPALSDTAVSEGKERCLPVHLQNSNSPHSPGDTESDAPYVVRFALGEGLRVAIDEGDDDGIFPSQTDICPRVSPITAWLGTRRRSGRLCRTSLRSMHSAINSRMRLRGQSLIVAQPNGGAPERSGIAAASE